MPTKKATPPDHYGQLFTIAAMSVAAARGTLEFAAQGARDDEYLRDGERAPDPRNQVVLQLCADLIRRLSEVEKRFRVDRRSSQRIPAQEPAGGEAMPF